MKIKIPRELDLEQNLGFIRKNSYALCRQIQNYSSCILPEACLPDTASGKTDIFPSVNLRQSLIDIAAYVLPTQFEKTDSFDQ